MNIDIATTTASFTTNRIELNRALARLNKTVNHRAPKAVLRNMRLRVNGYVKLSANDLDVQHDEYLNETQRTGIRTAIVDAKAFKASITGLATRRCKNLSKPASLLLLASVSSSAGMSLPSESVS